MKLILACVVSATALAGCGGGESSWQDEWRDNAGHAVVALDEENVQYLCSAIETGEADWEAWGIGQRGLFSADADRVYDPGIRSLNVILADYRLEQTPAILDEAVQIFIDNFERVCP